ncbi:hypothetical protein VTN96DRAFT_5872 [Rasamsonia emersonii]|uniref:Ureidoglycolate hydrolase n=1 Tax=Rasamsonia emersonii (strain ATCC 16479 / CBS 393.64 / IMI 116815) TaxID=1408163 RepID=A0A0F4Z0W9_RASE3|nr:Ureidoglycolate hydrolase [Rasamsonia emersonii CBS 393.64]KKA23731.1 Ureidoglycolate hydrolase [Rasamsonia emersonii CBS 393.64]
MPAPTLVSPPPSLRIIPEPLTADAFAPFGTVISSPLPRDLSAAPRASALASLPLPHSLAAPPVLANQGSALKYSPISPLENGYEACPSGKRAQARMSMFSCFPRKLRRESIRNRNRNRSSRSTSMSTSSRHGGGGGAEEYLTEDIAVGVGGGGSSSSFSTPVFDVRILERHPFTTQTFIPIDLSSQRRVVRDSGSYSDGDSGSGSSSVRGKASFDDGSGHSDILLEEEVPEEDEPVFLVLVAPTLKGQTAAATVTSSASSSPSGDNNDTDDRKKRVHIRDPPDLENLRAFIARGGQAVTYAAGTWHAPMVVLGRRRVDFVVVQFVNGVEEEDCQEAAFAEGIVVDLASLENVETGEDLTGLLGRRAKL